jgi:pimeloyl-ACP methyl ester carboxylesterase
LSDRLTRTRWNDSVQEGWTYGTDRSFLHQLRDYWIKEYDWPTRESLLNRLPHQRALIEGFGIHFLHFRGNGPAPTPLLLLNGWPSSFIEYQKLAPLLADPAASDAVGCFDVVIPALPGFGFSERPQMPFQVDAVKLFVELMKQLGYQQFLVAGTDIGAGVATRIALQFPERVIGIHIAAVADPPTRADSAPLSKTEVGYREQQDKWKDEEGAYQAVQCTRPQTLAFGLTDSPIGLASWICEKFYAWSDCNGDVLSVFSFDMLIDNLMVYWTTRTIGSSVRYYFDSRHFRSPFAADDFVAPPTGIMVLPKDLVQPPREWAERFYNVRRYSRLTRGGHFPAWEVPELYAQELRAFTASLKS